MLSKGTLLARLKNFNESRTLPAGRKNLSLLAKPVKDQLVDQFPGLAERDLSAYEFELKRTAYSDARTDCLVYDGNGKLRYVGRTFGGRRYSFWEHR